MKTENLVLMIVLIILALFVFSNLFGYGTRGYNYGMMGMMNNFFGGFGFMWLYGSLFMILIFVALVLFVVWLVRQLQQPQHLSRQEIRRRR